MVEVPTLHVTVRADRPKEHASRSMAPSRTFDPRVLM